MNDSVKQMVGGNGSLIVCCVFYLLWWIIAFRPEHPGSRMVSGVLLILAVITGLAGVFFAIRGMNGLEMERGKITSTTIVLIGAALYAVLFVVTWMVMKRQLTTELFLILGWAVLELSMLNAMYGSTLMGSGRAIGLSVVVGIAVVISLVCYLMYYKLSGQKSYVDGMIPLITEAVTMGIITIGLG